MKKSIFSVPGIHVEAKWSKDTQKNFFLPINLKLEVRA